MPRASLTTIALPSLVLAVVGGMVAWAQQQQPAPEESPLLAEPESPEDLFEAVTLLVDLARPRLARLYLDKFSEAEPDDTLLLKLRDQFGTGTFLKLSRIKELQPLSVRLLEQLTEASRRQASDPAYVDSILAELGGPSEDQEAAIRELRNAGPRAVPRILQRLADPNNAHQRNLLVYVLTRLGRQVVPPLIGALESPNDLLRSAAIQALGYLGAPEAVPYLWHPAFGDDQPGGVQTTAREALARLLFGSERKVSELTSYGAVNELMRLSRIHYRGEMPWPQDAAGRATVWRWDPTRSTVAAVPMTPQEASLAVGFRFAEQAIQLAPENVEAQELFLGLALARSVQEAGWDNPVPAGPGTAFNLALVSGSQRLTDVLDDALKSRRTDTAVAALGVLSQIGTRDQLSGRDAARSPIRRALSYPDRRVQFGAATAILQIDPEHVFAGSQRVVSILRRALHDGGKRTAVISDADSDRAAETGAFMTDLGYDAEVVPTGKRAFVAAAESIDVELIMLHANTIQWGLSQTVANLRADARTASLPIVIYGPESSGRAIQHLLARTPLAAYVTETSSLEDFKFQVEPFLDSIATPQLSARERAEQRAAAIFWFAHIAGSNRTEIYDISPAESGLYTSVLDPELAPDALVALGAIPAVSAQQSMAEAAVNENLDTPTRNRAALQLAFHIQRFGLLLEDREVLGIQSAWREAADPTLKTSLASVIGSLKPSTRLIGERLKGFEPPQLAPEQPAPPEPDAAPEPAPAPAP